MKSSDRFESVASVLEGSILGTVEAWLERVEIDQMIMAIPLSREKRTGHIPKLLIDLVNRLRLPSPLGADAKELVSIAAEQHGQLRREQGYSAAMLVEESRMFEISVFDTLRLNTDRLDLSVLMADVMVIADETDSQLAQALASYTQASSALAA